MTTSAPAKTNNSSFDAMVERLVGLSDEREFLNAFSQLLVSVTGCQEMGILHRHEGKIQFYESSASAKERSAGYFASNDFPTAFHSASQNRDTVNFADASESETVNSIDSSAPSLFHFLVPTFHREQCNSVIWLTNHNLPTQSPAIAETLHNLAIVSKLRKYELQHSTRINELSSKHKAEIETVSQQAESFRLLASGSAQAQSVGNSISTSLEKEKSGFQIASELNEHLDVERVTIVDLVGKKFTVIAVSGQPTINPRANIVRATQTMVQRIGITGSPIFFEGDLEGFPESTQQAVQQYLDESLVSSFAIFPLTESTEQVYESEEQSLVEVVNPGQTHDQKITGAVIAEYVTMPMDVDLLQARWASVETAVQNQHNNAKKYSELLFLPAQQMLTKFFALYRGHTKRLAALITAGIFISLILSLLIPTSFNVRCEGVLNPQGLYSVFAPMQGTVLSLPVEEGDYVEEGDLLVEMVDFELEKSLEDATGELERIKASLVENQRQQISNLAADPSERKSLQNKLAKEASDLKMKLLGKSRMVELLEREASQMKVLAPFGGKVIGWNIDKRYQDRTLEPGVKLFSLAPANADWVLELKVPDKRAGYIHQARAESDQQNLAADFMIASMASDVFDSKVTRINPNLEEDSDLGYVLPIKAVPLKSLPDGIRAGTPVVAKVKCGKRSFLYCRSYEFQDWLNRAFFEYLF